MHHHGHHQKRHDHAQMVSDYKKRFIISVVLSLPVAMLSPMLQHLIGTEELFRFSGDKWVLWLFASAIFIYGGHPFLYGFFNELKNKQPGMMTLIGIAIMTAYVYSSAVVFGLEGMEIFFELATLIDIMLIGHWIEMKSVMGASKALEALAKLIPSKAFKILRDGTLEEVAIENLGPKDRVLVKPGQKIPVDGVILSGTSYINESMLTGESLPIKKLVSDLVIAGSINGEGSLEIEVKKLGKDSYLNQVINLVKEAQTSKSKTQNLANRAAKWLTVVALLGGFSTFILWVFLSDNSMAFAIERAVTVMVIACPHALGLAIPLVVAVSTSIAARNGLLIRNRLAFEQARNVQALVLDKTGTLTKGNFGITNVISFSKDFSESEIVKLAASIEQHSEHPIAKGIVASAKEFYKVTNFKAITGKGALAKIDQREYFVVSPAFLKEEGIALQNDHRIFAKPGLVETVVYVLKERELIGAIALADLIREDSKRAIQRIKSMGIKCIMLTGDNAQVAEHIAREVGIDEFFAQLLPHEKVKKIQEIQNRGLVVAMAGDGVNDAPALAQANVGIAIGAGSDIAVETGDIILVRSNPADIASVLTLSRSTYKKMIQNLAWATGYNIIAIPLAAGVFFSFGLVLSPALAAVFMGASTVIAAINARLLKL